MLTVPSVHPALMALLTGAPPEREWLAALSQQDWETIVEDAVAQRLAPILFHWLDHSPHQLLLPGHSHQRLHRHILQQAAWNLLLTEELHRILVACETRHIRCLPIRGPLFAAQLYGESAVRQMDDLDLLVQHDDLPALKEIFDQLGYAAHEQRPGFLEAFSYSLEFYHPRHGVIVEPHWTLAYPPFVTAAPMEPVWARTERRRILGIETSTLCHADLLLHLCLHLLHKGTQAPLLWYYEIDRLIRQNKDSLNWNTVVDQAREMGLAGLIAEVLATIAYHFHSPMPRSILNRLRTPSRNGALRSPAPVREWMLTHSSLNGREEFALLCSLPGLRSKLAYAAALLFPSPRYMAQRYALSGPLDLPRAYLGRISRLFWDSCRWTTACVLAALTQRQN